MRAGGRMETERERERDRTKIIVAFHNFANGPKNGLSYFQ